MVLALSSTPMKCAGRGYKYFPKILVQEGGTKIFQKSWIHLKILGALRGTRNKFYPEDPLKLGATVLTLATQGNWRPGFVDPWCTGYNRG